MGPGNNENRPARPRRRAAAFGIYVLLVLAGIVAAWQIHLFLRSGRQGPGAAATRPRPGSLSATQPAWSASAAADDGDLLSLATDPAGRAGLRALIGDPADLAPPPRAVRRSAFSRADGDGAVQFASYDYKGAAQTALSHYDHLLSGKGFAAVGKAAGAAATTAVYDRGRHQVRVSLRKRGRETSIIRIVVIATGWPAHQPPPRSIKD